MEGWHLDLMMSPSMEKARISYDGYAMARLSYSGHNSSELASPFMGKRHPAKNLPTEYDAQAVVQTSKLLDTLYLDTDVESVLIEAAGDQLLVNGVDVGDAQGEAAGRYGWTPLAGMLNGCQHAGFITVQLKDGGPLLLLCKEEIDLSMCVAHV